MPSPKSPLDKSSNSRKPTIIRRTSSDKSISKAAALSSTSTIKHGVKAGHYSGKTKDPMSDMSVGAEGLSRSDAVENKDRRPEQDADMKKTADEEDRSMESGKHSPLAAHESGLPKGYRRGEIPENTSAEEVERLRAAMNAQLQLHQHRERLAKHLGERGDAKSRDPAVSTGGRPRVSPIHEETLSPTMEAAFASPLSGLETASSESAATVRGGTTPAAMPARTPSYPFPPMRTPGLLSRSDSGHHPFMSLSPTVNPTNYSGGMFDGSIHDQILSGSVTPASTLHFQPSGTNGSQEEDPKYPTPNLYDMSLMLSAEPGLDPWWTTVVQLMKELYKADRVTLSVPADTTDVENVPWGQKATFSVVEEDELSVTYLPRGSSMVPSSVDTNETSNSDNPDESPPMFMPLPSTARLARPGLLSRHSFTSFEDSRPGGSQTLPVRPIPLTRAKSYLSARPDLTPPRAGTLQNAQLNLQSLQDHMDFEDAKTSQPWEDAETASRDVRGRVFSVLQALDYEADPLIDSTGILRVLERGKVIALTRDYPYLDNPEDEKSAGSKSSERSSRSRASIEKKKPPELGSRISSFLGNKSSRRPVRSVQNQTSEKGRSIPAPARDFDEAPTVSLRYEEYEQTPPSPWAQSPAPSPAVRSESGDNPFFANTPIDEETFNPTASTPQDYSKLQPLEAIGIDRSWTVLHIPLSHPLLSKPVQSFRLDAAAIESKSAGRGKRGDYLPKYPDGAKAQEQVKEKRTPIAILSILTPVIPYPSNLRNSLEHLSPHLATSFSLCRHYSNLENEIAGLSRKRPQTAGFGAVAPGTRLRKSHGTFGYSPSEENGPPRYAGGSITSPSEYSGMSRSTAGSSTGTPGWDPASVGLSMDKRSSGGSPSLGSHGESYFTPSTRPSVGRVDTGLSITGARKTASKGKSPVDARSQQQGRNVEEYTAAEEKTPDSDASSTPDHEDDGNTGDMELGVNASVASTPRQEARSRADQSSQDPGVDISEPRNSSPSRKHQENALSTHRQAMRAALHTGTSHQGTRKSDRAHTQLHSYGADFGATFQSLPTSSNPVIRNQTLKGAVPQSIPTDMPPPSDRLKGLMLDSLPAHVFVALPQTGEIVWVNNRYLTYRGQTVPELYEDPWGSLHPDEREDYLKEWAHAVKTGEQFSMQVRIRRFDGTYRWFYTRAVASRDIRGVIVQWYGSHMDIHDQHIAEVKAARQEEIEASEAKHRQLANLIPQIIFAATEDEGVTFANEQWLSYTGQDFDDALGLGFMDYIHPDDLAKCHIPIDRPPTPRAKKPKGFARNTSHSSSGGTSSNVSDATTETTVKGVYQSLSRNNSSSSSSIYELPTADLSELARTGIIKVSTDADGRLSYTTEVRLKSKTGAYRWHLVRCVEVDNINLGSGDGSWFGACTDINDHKLLETKLKEAMESKGKFLSNMSHEIRTPLIGISGMVNFLQDTVLNDEQMDYTNTISSSATSLLNIINDILDLSKVDAGMMKLSYEWFHTRSLVEEVNEMVSTLAITKRLELNYVVDVDVPEMVKGDKFRMRQVLLNVIGNAIKFTTVGEVFTRCRVIADNLAHVGENEIRLEFSVIDTGRGFTKDEGDMIFKPFSQIDGSSTRQHGGSGLGLVISRQLVELHGGQMEGSAVPDQGSTFTFTAVFGMPTPEDHPDEPPQTPISAKVHPTRVSLLRSSSVSDQISARALRQAGGNPILANKFMQSPSAVSPGTASTIDSPTMLSSASSDPSIHSSRSHTRSSVSSIAQSLLNFSEAARASASDLSQMKLALPEKHSTSPSTSSVSSPIASKFGRTQDSSTPGTDSSYGEALSRENSSSSQDLKHSLPDMFSILVLCPQKHSREATTQHIEITLPKDIPHQITPLSTVAEAQELIGGEDPVVFTHIVLNLPDAEDIVMLIDQIITSVSFPQPSIVVLSDPVQRQEVVKMADSYNYEQLAKDFRVRFIYKPVKPSRFAVIFDPEKERNLSTDRNRSSAQQQVANQKQNYVDVGKRLGNKGLKVLLVEDNLVNQKVLLKFLSKVGIAVELALDGVECTEMVLSRPHSFFSLILCDLHMPRKDGYQTCREIREWEAKESLPRMPIIALSANVMADVLDKCVQAGFNSYVTKPVDFKALSKAMSDLLDPSSPQPLLDQKL